ncbi:myosin-10-like [Leptopilina heterotoma]|uniref:myosin-10-like n=1 Tax=Leptopilina heterotoma TaxID=63436 RepID=UPI001CA9F072|nr:myosin-10-like [Leptopilina heterotoma]
MLERSKTFLGLIGFLLLKLQALMTISTLNMLGFSEINFLASELTPSECFQLYNMSRGRHLKVETEDFLRRKRYEVPCINLLSTWLTDPDEYNFNFDNLTLTLTQIGREDLVFELDRRKVTISPENKDLETERNCCGKTEENEEEYCLCADKLKETSFEDYCTNKKKSSYFKQMFSKCNEYFTKRREEKKEKLRNEKFQKLKKKLQKMYLERQKDIRVNRQEERILNSLTERERDELGEILCQMRFFLNSDKETERLLLSGKRSGTFIIDMKNLHRPKITHSHLTNQEIRKLKSRDFSASLSDEMTDCPVQRKTCSECEITKRKPEKRNHRKSSNHRREYEKYSKHKRRNKNSKLIELEETSEFIKCYTMSESEQCSSPTMKINNRFYESERKTNIFTSEESEMTTFRSENYQNPLNNKIQSDVENQKKKSADVIKSKSMTELESLKINQVSELIPEKENQGDFKFHRTENLSKTFNSCPIATCDNKTKIRDVSEKGKQNQGDYFKIYEPVEIKNLSKTDFCWPPATCNSKINLEKSNENLAFFENLERGDTESQLDFRKTCDELSLLVSQQMKQQSYPCERKYCLLRRHLKHRIHDLKQCQFKENFHQYYSNNDAPSCGVGRICRDTYDEFKLMKAMPHERKEIKKSIFKRRKEFLDQPCVSPKKKCFNYSSIGTM